MAIISLIEMVFQPPARGTTEFIGMLSYFNSLTDVGQGGMFWTVMLIVFGGIIFMMMRAYSPEKSLGITSIIICVVAILFRILSWVNDYVVTVCVIIMAFGIYLLVKEAAPYEQ